MVKRKKVDQVQFRPSSGGDGSKCANFPRQIEIRCSEHSDQLHFTSKLSSVVKPFSEGYARAMVASRKSQSASVPRNKVSALGIG